MSRYRKYRKESLFANLASRERKKEVMSNHNTLSDAQKGSLSSARSRCNKTIGQDVSGQPTDAVPEDYLISLLHLENLSGLQSFVKYRSHDYYTLEQYLYCDIIPEEPIRRNSVIESDAKED
jgi:hypothetical protein